MQLIKLIQTNKMFATKRLVFKGGGEVPSVAETVKPARLSEAKLAKMTGAQLENHLLQQEQRIDGIANKVAREGYQDRADQMRARFKGIQATLIAKHSLLKINGSIADGKDASELLKDAEAAREALSKTAESLTRNLERQKNYSLNILNSVVVTTDQEFADDLEGIKKEVRGISTKMSGEMTIGEMKKWAEGQMKQIVAKTPGGAEYKAIADKAYYRADVRKERATLVGKLKDLHGRAESAANPDLANQLKAGYQTLTDMKEPDAGSNKAQWKAYSAEVNLHYEGMTKYYAEKSEEHEKKLFDFQEQERLYAETSDKIEDKRDAIEDKILIVGVWDDPNLSQAIKEAGKQAITELDAIEKGLRTPQMGETTQDMYRLASNRVDVIVGTFERVELKQNVVDNGGEDLIVTVVDKADSFKSIEEFNKAFDAALQAAQGSLTPGKYDRPDPDKIAKLSALTKQAEELRSNIVSGMMIKEGLEWVKGKVEGAKDTMDQMIAGAKDWLGNKTEQVAEAAKLLETKNRASNLIAQAAREVKTPKGPEGKATLFLLDSYKEDLNTLTKPEEVEDMLALISSVKDNYSRKLATYEKGLERRGKQLTQVANGKWVVKNAPGSKARRLRAAYQARMVAKAEEEGEKMREAVDSGTQKAIDAADKVLKPAKSPDLVEGGGL